MRLDKIRRETFLPAMIASFDRNGSHWPENSKIYSLSDAALARSTPILRVCAKAPPTSKAAELWMSAIMVFSLAALRPLAIACVINRELALAILRRLHLPSQAKGIAHAALFGSIARGQNGEDSDVDVVIAPIEGIAPRSD